MADEMWKDVPGYEGKYQISSAGRVKSLKRKGSDGRQIAGCIRKTFLTPAGYVYLSLYKNGGKRYTEHVHRMVAAAFIGPRPNGMQINHKNGDKADNRVENLEYVTPSENVQHAYDELGAIGPRGENQGHSVLTTQQAVEIKRLLAFTRMTQPQIGKLMQVSRNVVGSIYRGESWAWLDEESPRLKRWAEIAKDRESSYVIRKRTYKCKYCGKKFRRKPYNLGAGYCSRSCGARARGKNGRTKKAAPCRDGRADHNR